MFPEPGKRRKSIALQSSEPNETQEARHKSRRISMRKHTCYEDSKGRNSTEEIKKSFIKEVVKKVVWEEEGSTVGAMPIL